MDGGGVSTLTKEGRPKPQVKVNPNAQFVLEILALVVVKSLLGVAFRLHTL